MKRHLVEEFVTTATIHGIGRSGNPKLTRRRYVWMVLTLFMAFSLVGFTIKAFIDYSKHPTLTTVSPINKEEMEFPAVTICNMNMVRKDVTLCDPAFSEDIADVFFKFGETPVIVNELFSFTGGYKTSTLTGQQLLNCVYNFSNTLETMLPMCIWKGSLVPCNSIFKPTLTDYGLCYTFNGDASAQQTTVFPGPDSGLRVFVDIRLDDYFFSKTIQAGVKVVLHQPREDPIPSWRGFLVAPGLSAQAVISRTKKKYLGKPYGECVSDDDVTLKRFSIYTENHCRMECMIDRLTIGHENCPSCRYFLHPGTERLCGIFELLECASYYLNVSVNMDFLSRCSCPQSCTVWTYENSLSYGYFASNFINKYFVDKNMLPSVNYSRENFIDLRIFYDSMTDTIIKEVPEKDIFDIISDLGGLMGIFLGASLLSLVEIIEFFLLLLTSRNVSVVSKTKDVEDPPSNALEDGNKKIKQKFRSGRTQPVNKVGQRRIR